MTGAARDDGLPDWIVAMLIALFLAGAAVVLFL